MAQIKLGSKVRDRLTGFEGVATDRNETYGGFKQLRIARAKADGSLAQEWFPEKQVEYFPGEQAALTSLDPIPDADHTDAG